MHSMHPKYIFIMCCMFHKIDLDVSWPTTSSHMAGPKGLKWQFWEFLDFLILLGYNSVKTTIFLKIPYDFFEKGRNNNMIILRPKGGHCVTTGFARSVLVSIYLEHIIFPIFRGLLCILATSNCPTNVFILCSMFHRVDLTCMVIFSTLTSPQIATAQGLKLLFWSFSLIIFWVL